MGLLEINVLLGGAFERERVAQNSPAARRQGFDSAGRQCRRHGAARLPLLIEDLLASVHGNILKRGGPDIFHLDLGLHSVMMEIDGVGVVIGRGYLGTEELRLGPRDDETEAVGAALRDAIVVEVGDPEAQSAALEPIPRKSLLVDRGMIVDIQLRIELSGESGDADDILVLDEQNAVSRRGRRDLGYGSARGRGERLRLRNLCRNSDRSGPDRHRSGSV